MTGYPFCLSRPFWIFMLISLWKAFFQWCRVSITIFPSLLSFLSHLSVCIITGLGSFYLSPSFYLREKEWVIQITYTNKVSPLFFIIVIKNVFYLSQILIKLGSKLCHWPAMPARGWNVTHVRYAWPVSFQFIIARKRNTFESIWSHQNVSFHLIFRPLSVNGAWLSGVLLVGNVSLSLFAQGIHADNTVLQYKATFREWIYFSSDVGWSRTGVTPRWKLRTLSRFHDSVNRFLVTTTNPTATDW